MPRSEIDQTLDTIENLNFLQEAGYLTPEYYAQRLGEEMDRLRVLRSQVDD